MIFLAKLCPSLPIIWKLCWVVEWPVLSLWWCIEEGSWRSLESFSKGPGSFSYVFIIAGKVTALEPIYGPTFVDHGSLSLGTPVAFDGAITFEVGLYTIPLTDIFNAFAETLDVWYYYMTLGFNFNGNRLGASSALATSSIIDLTGWPGESFLHLVQSPFGVFTISNCFPKMLHFVLENLRIATNSFGPMGESTNNTIFNWEMMVAVPL